MLAIRLFTWLNCHGGTAFKWFTILPRVHIIRPFNHKREFWIVFGKRDKNKRGVNFRRRKNSYNIGFVTQFDRK